MVQADGSIVVDTTGLSIDEVLERIEQLLERHMTKISTKLVGNKLVDRIAYQIVRFIVTTFCRVWCRMTVEGRENVPAEGIFILAPTHRSILDTPIASGVTRRRMRFMGADKYWKNKAFGRLLTALGGFPVSRGTADREALKRSIAVLQGGEPLGVVPRGRAQGRADRAAAVRRRDLHRRQGRCADHSRRDRWLGASHAKGCQVHSAQQAARRGRQADPGRDRSPRARRISATRRDS